MRMKSNELPTVLVVEDEALLAMLLDDTLSRAGYKVIHATNRQMAKDLADADTVLAAVVIDLNLGDKVDGREELRRLRERHPDLPAVVTSAFGLDAPQANLRGVGGPTSRLLKPYDGRDLAEKLTKLVNQPASTFQANRGRRRND